MMRILFFTPVNISSKNGFEKWLYELTKFLKKKGHYIHIIDTRYPEHKEIKWKTINKRTTIRTEKFHRIISEDVKRIKKISEDYDVIYFNQINIGHAKIFSKLKIKKIAGYHASLFRNHLIFDIYLKLFGRKYLKLFDAHHVINSNDLNQVKKWGFKNPFFIPNGIDTKRFSCNKSKSHHDKFKVLFVGRHELHKGFDVLLKAIKEIDEHQIEFTFTGKGSLTSLLIELMKIKNNVKYKGFVDDMSKEYCNHDLLIIPSRSEQFGLVIAEAQSCGLIVLSTPTPGANDIIKNRETGFIMKKLSVKELIRNIKFVKNFYYTNQSSYKKMKLNGRVNIINNYSLEKMNEGLLNMFKKTVKS